MVERMKVIMIITVVLVTTSIWIAPPTQRSVDTLVASFTAQDWAVRAAALRDLKTLVDNEPDLLAQPAVRLGVIQLLERENALIEERFTLGISSEDLVDYYFGLLIPLCDQTLAAADPDPRLLTALINSAYNSDSEIVARFAAYGSLVSEATLKLMANALVVKRWNGYAIAGQLLAFQRQGKLRDPIREDMAQQLVEALRSGLQDPDVSGRRDAIRGIVVAGDKGAIPLLVQLAEHDPDTAAGPSVRYTVRGLAREAIKKLQQ